MNDAGYSPTPTNQKPSGIVYRFLVWIEQVLRPRVFLDT